MADIYFKWDAQKLSTHVESMDAEHMLLVDLMNRLHQRHQEGAAFWELKKIMESLHSWTVLHFEHEEALFSSIPYAEAEAHKKIHQELLARLEDHKSQFEYDQVLGERFFKFLKAWLTAHIMGIDSKYGEAALRLEQTKGARRRA